MTWVRSRWVRSRRASAAVEFAIVATVLIPLTFAIIELGLVLWMQTAMQSVASQTARCAAIGSPQCSGNVPAYAVTLANNWTLAGAITQSNVAVSATTTCNGASATFEKVTISVPIWSTTMLQPFWPDTITVSSCYPT
jgi:Flp pilus assembly protein TadG